MSTFPIPALELINQRPCTTSLAIATHFEKQHKHVLDSIRELQTECPSNFNGSNFRLVKYQDAKGEKRPMYHVFFDGFMLLVMGYTGKKALAMKLAYIEAFNAMKARLEEERLNNAPALDSIIRVIIDAKVIQASGAGSLKRVLYARAWNSFRARFGLGKK